jgi:hypothetical protein
MIYIGRSPWGGGVRRIFYSILIVGYQYLQIFKRTCWQITARETGKCNCLSYFFKVRNRTEDSWDIEFSGAYRESLPKVIGQLSIKTTTIVRIERLCFAFTFIEAAIKADGEMSSIEKQYPDSIAPKIIKEKIPEYPSELREARREGVFSFLGIITGQGTVDRSHGIILECSHWLFLRNALATMFNDWQFTPGQSGGKAVETIRELSWPFLLRHQVVNPIKTWRREYQ